MTTTAARICRSLPVSSETSLNIDAAIFSAFTITATFWLLVTTAVRLLRRGGAPIVTVGPLLTKRSWKRLATTLPSNAFNDSFSVNCGERNCG